MATALQKFGEFSKGVAKGFYGGVVKPYASLIGEAAYQGGRYLVDPTFRKAIRAPESLSQEEIYKVNKPRQTAFLRPQQIQTRKQTVLTGGAATLKAGLAATAFFNPATGVFNPATALTTAGIAGGLTYGAQKLFRQPTNFEQIGRAVGESHVYAGVGKLTLPIQNTLASYFSTGLMTKGLTNFLLRAGIKGTTAGGFNVAENYLTAPLLEGRQPTKEENALAFGIGLLGGAGDEGFQAIRNKIKGGIRLRQPGQSEQYYETETGKFIRNLRGQFIKFEPNKKEPKYYGDLREELGLPRYGVDPRKIKLGLSVQEITPEQRAKLPTQPKGVGGEILYHGTSVENANKIKTQGFDIFAEGNKGGGGNKGFGVSLSKKENVAKLHAGEKGNTISLTLDSNAKIFKASDVPQEYIKAGHMTAMEAETYAKLHGFDGIDLENLEAGGIIRGGRVGVKESEVLIFNPKVLNPTQPKGVGEEVPVGLKERGFIKTVREAETTAPEVAEQVKGFYKPITNAETIQKAQSTIDTQGWDVAKQQALSNVQSAENTAIGLELMRRAQNLGNYDEAVNIAEKLAAKGTQGGQAIQAFSIWGRMTPEGMLRYAAKQINKSQLEAGFASKLANKIFGIKAPKLTPDDAAKITDLMKKANATESEEVKAQYVKQSLEVINDKIPYGVNELIDTYRYNNLLSNPLTHLRNFTSNALQTFLTRPLTKAVSGDIRGAYKYYGGLYKGWSDAVSDANKAFKGLTPLEKPDIQGLRLKKAPGILTVPTRMMEASDKFFQGLIRGGELASGKSLDEATRTAKYSLFRTALDPTGDKTGQGYLLKGIDNATQGFTQFGKKFPMLRWFVPFIQTPMNVSKQWLEYSPAGLATIPGAQNKAEQVAKTLIGSTVTMLGAKLAFDGRTTWAAPSDPEQKDLFYASGKKPFSVKVGDSWVPMQTLGVFSFPMALAVAAKHYQEDNRTVLTDNQTEKLTKTLASQVEFFSGQTFMEGLGNFVSLVQGDKDYSLPGNIAFTSTQFIPFTGLASYISRLIDPVYRKVEGEGFFEKAGQTIARGIPFASKKLAPFEKPGGEIETRNITDYIAPYAAGKEDIKYTVPFESRQTTLQENAVLNKSFKKYDDIKSRVEELLELGNEQVIL